MRFLAAFLALSLAACGGGAADMSAPVAAAAPAPQKLSPNVTIFIGDSITSRWATELLVPGSVNKGVPGETPCQIRDRFQADVLDLRPQRVHILGGANVIASDTPPESDCIIDMATRAIAAGIVTYVGTVTPGLDRPQAGVLYFNEKLRTAALALGFTIIDYYPPMVINGLYFDQALYLDTVHPSAAGYTRMEGVFHAMVR